MDASTYGWGLVYSPFSTRGVLLRNHVDLHINYFKQETVFLALKRFQRLLHESLSPFYQDHLVLLTAPRWSDLK